MKTFASLAWSSLLTAGLLISPAVQAHDDAYLDTLTTPHGGQLRMAGAQHYELVLAKDGTEAKASPVIVYVTDHAGTPVKTAGANGSVTILSGKRKISVALQPDGDNRLKGSATYASNPALKAVVNITLAGQPPQQARFTPLAPRPSNHSDHNH
jgi:hypothetical protein